MPPDKTIDTVLMIIAGGLLTMGLLSLLIGWLVRKWDRFVNRSQIVMSSIQEDDSADDTDGRTDGRSASAINPWLARLEVDRTKQALIELLVYSEWTVDEVRAVIKGANADIGDEVKAARQRLGIDPPDRQLRVRDASGERVIPMR